ncbi:FAD-dependent thymidylate synthase [Rhodococcus sp. KRD197]|uniref:FAD-dependent thymidylate synthase n=1 Tax=Rhodococcus sp. KRD197 TaxID=2729731 RepID=UPI0019D08B12|nr:FAD-dependent thymidylate synthase [Rhodococcus sp. KRD197]
MKITVVAETSCVIPEDHDFFQETYSGPVNAGYEPSGVELTVEFAALSRTHLIWRVDDGRHNTRDYLRFLLSASAWRFLEHSFVTFYVEDIAISLANQLHSRDGLVISERAQRNTRYDRFEIGPTLPEEVEAHDDLRAEMHELFQHSVRVWGNIRNKLRNRGVYSEYSAAAARAALPNMATTKLTVTGSVRSWAQLLVECDSVRSEPDMQRFAESIGAILAERHPALFGDVRFEVWDVDKNEKWAVSNRSGRAMRHP